MILFCYSRYDLFRLVILGMICAVRFSVDQLFYRAEILNVVDANCIAVKYVDYGNTEIVSVQRIRKLLDVYTVLTVQVLLTTVAVRCLPISPNFCSGYDKI